MNTFEERLTGGHPNSLGNTVAIVEEVLAKPALFDDLFLCYQSNDEVVRLRVSNGVKRVCKAQPELLVPYIDRLIGEISTIDQASTKWTLAQLFDMLCDRMSDRQRSAATEIMKGNLANGTDWIVLIKTLQTLAAWAKHDQELKAWLIPHAKRLSTDSRKSVAKTAARFYDALQGNI